MSDSLRAQERSSRGEARPPAPSAEGARPRPGRLSREKSPYLLQHAHNPVDWYPWGEEAFERARREEKPIFLSIGYSTCHWCHVMERESFEDPEVAALLDQGFVCIKVDREERPDIDTVYMGACQVLNGSGGWPLTILMTADQKPFFAATYVPKHSTGGRLGLMELIPRVRELWADRRDEVLASAERITAALCEAGQGGEPGKICPETVARAVQQLGSAFDPQAGGFGGAPKFPVPHNLRLLLRHARRQGDGDARRMALFSLDQMRRGGIYDHIGFGFHRYSTDAAWQVPHFEKMLYDQALIAKAYIEAYLATGQAAYGQTAREVCAYVLRDLTGPEGAFLCGEDADSEGQEGRFYLWTRAEIEAALGSGEAELFCGLFGVLAEGNYSDEATGERTGRSVLHLAEPLSRSARELGLSEAELGERLERARATLFELRAARPRPCRDDKVLTDWNGLMISALALAARAFGDEALARAARRAADFLLSRMLLPDGALLHRYRDGEAAQRGFLDDYAFLAGGLIDLYEATAELGYLRAARELTRYQLEHFWDEERGGFYLAADDSDPLIVRSRDIYDGALPSGNSISLLNLARLGRILGEPDLALRGRRIADTFAPTVRQAPMAFTQVLLSVCHLRWPGLMVAVAGPAAAPETAALLRAARAAYNPCGTVLFRGAAGEDAEILELMPHLAGLEARRSAAYVQADGTWEPAITEPAELLARLS